MDKIDFVNGRSGGSPINDTNLNLMQDNIERAINAVAMDVTDLDTAVSNIVSKVSNAKTAEDVAQTLGSLGQLEKINDLEASLAETKEELLNRTGGLKAKVTVAMILSIVNFIGVAVLVAIAFGFL